MTSSGPNPKGSQGTLASQQQSQSQQSQQPASQSHNSPGGSGREQREQRNSRSSRRKGSDSSVPEEDKDRREETTGRGEDSHKKILYIHVYGSTAILVITATLLFPWQNDWNAYCFVTETFIILVSLCFLKNNTKPATLKKWILIWLLYVVMKRSTWIGVYCY